MDLPATSARVHLPAALRDVLIRHAREEAPNECCGLLIGRGSSISDVVPTRNVASTPATRYAIDPAEHIAVNRRLRGSGLAVVGAYHSHPRGPARPSATDRAEAHYPDFVWVIVSLLPPDGCVAAFRLAEDRAHPVDIELEP
jgi:proteasome lid subunit RPN8/RPN11